MISTTDLAYIHLRMQPEDFFLVMRIFFLNFQIHNTVLLTVAGTFIILPELQFSHLKEVGSQAFFSGLG